MSCLKIAKSNRSLALFLLLALFPVTLVAQGTPVIFQRANIRIDPVLAGLAEDGKGSVTVRQSSGFNIEVRPQEALRLEYIHTLNTLTDESGVMVLFTAPAVTPLPAFRNYTPVDALFIDETGIILQILPRAILAEMAQPVAAAKPVRAFLFLKAGTVQARMIQPQDAVIGGMFTPAPAVMH